MEGAHEGQQGDEARGGWGDGMTAPPRPWWDGGGGVAARVVIMSKRRVLLAMRRVLYRRMAISLAADDWYDRLTHATGRGGWQVIRADGDLVQLERPRLRLP